MTTNNWRELTPAEAHVIERKGRNPIAIDLLSDCSAIAKRNRNRLVAGCRKRHRAQRIILTADERG